jgi:hypothetical protein
MGSFIKKEIIGIRWINRPLERITTLWHNIALFTHGARGAKHNKCNYKLQGKQVERTGAVDIGSLQS